MLVYEDERVDFLLGSDLLESSYVQMCVMSGCARYTM